MSEDATIDPAGTPAPEATGAPDGPEATDTAVPADTADAADAVNTAPVPTEDLTAAVEAILFVLESPIAPAALAAALARPVADIDHALATLRDGYDERGAGIELRAVGEGVRIYTRPALAPYVERFLRDGQRARLSQAALETLAVIAYRQPVTRSRVAAIRGVNVDGVVRTLLTRGLIVDVGTESESGATLLRTTDLFLEKLGMRSLEELPSLAPLLPDLDSIDDAGTDD